MSIENVSSAPTAPAAATLSTENVEDFSTRIHMVQEAADEERRASLRESSDDAETSSDTPDETDESADDGEDAPVKAAPKAAEKPAPATPSPEDAARKASLANAARLERESVKRSTELASKAAELKAQEAKFSEREQVLSNFEKAYNDPDALLALLAERVTPEKMSQFFLEAGQPDKVAERRAKAAQEPVTSEITKLREELSAMKKEAEEKATKEQARAARAENEKLFSERVLENKADAPRAARLLSKRPKEFFAMADASATQLMAAAQAEGKPTPTWDDVIRDVHDQLESFTRDLQDEVAPAAPSANEKTTKSTAAAKANTVSNRAASDRSAILNEDESWENLPLEERVKRAVKRAHQTG